MDAENPLEWLRAALVERLGEAAADRLLHTYHAKLATFVAGQKQHLAQYGQTDVTVEDVFEYLGAFIDESGDTYLKGYTAGLKACEQPASQSPATHVRTA